VVELVMEIDSVCGEGCGGFSVKMLDCLSGMQPYQGVVIF